MITHKEEWGLIKSTLTSIANDTSWKEDSEFAKRLAATLRDAIEHSRLGSCSDAIYERLIDAFIEMRED